MIYLYLRSWISMARSKQSAARQVSHLAWDQARLGSLEINSQKDQASIDHSSENCVTWCKYTTRLTWILPESSPKNQLLELQTCISESCCDWRSRRIRGHQDESPPCGWWHVATMLETVPPWGLQRKVADVKSKEHKRTSGQYPVKTWTRCDNKYEKLVFVYI